MVNEISDQDKPPPIIVERDTRQIRELINQNLYQKFIETPKKRKVIPFKK